MTTNKPEVVAWRWRKPIVNDQGETVGTTAWELGDAPGFLPWWTNDPLIRLSDYEALQAVCEKLVEALEAIVSHHDEYFRDSSVESKMPWIGQAHAALAAYRKGGEL